MSKVVVRYLGDVISGVISAKISRDVQSDFELTPFKFFCKIFLKLFFIIPLFSHTSPKRPDRILANITGNISWKESVSIKISKSQKGEGLKVTVFTYDKYNCLRKGR